MFVSGALHVLYIYLFLYVCCLSCQKHALVEVVSHQTIVMQYILELGKQLSRDPRSCMPGFFERCERLYVHVYVCESRESKARHPKHMSVCVCVSTRIKTAERQYVDAFEDEISAFKGRVKARAQEKIEAAMAEEEEV